MAELRDNMTPHRLGSGEPHTRAFYTEEDGSFVPTGVGISPWNDRAQLGVGLAGLIVHAIEKVPAVVPMYAARLTIDILGAVPIEPLTASVRVVRDGRRVRLIDAELAIDGRVWVRATALYLRIGESPDRSAPPTRAFPADARPVSGDGWFEVVRLEGDYETPGPGASWARITVDAVAGTPLSSLVAVAMIADLGSGTAPLVSMSEWTYANVDISVHLIRPPQGEWFLLDAISESAGNGAGLIHSRLGDRHGMIGMGHQTTFLQPRG